MANVLNRSTKQYVASVNTPEYPVAEWIVNPDLSGVVGVPNKYWVVNGDVVTAMSQAEKDAVDAAEMTAFRDSTAARVDEVEDIIRALSLVLLDELNLHAERTNAILTAVDGAASLAALKTSVLAIQDVPLRTIAQLKNGLRSKLGS